ELLAVEQLAVGRRVHARVVEQGGVEDRRIDLLALARAVAVIETLEAGDGAQVPVPEVAARAHTEEGPAAVPHAAVLELRAAQRVAGLVVSAQLGAGAVLEGARVEIDDAGVDRPHLLVLDAEALGGAGPHV